MPARIYLDHAATTPLRPEVRDAMALCGELWGNPSSLHREGKDARDAIDQARQDLSDALGASEHRVVFTSGGTEADNAAILGTLTARLADGASPADLHVVASAVEHSAVHGALELAARWGVPHTLVPVDDEGRVDPGDVLGALRPETALVSLMTVNNEVGTVEPVYDVALALGELGVTFHTDAVQLLGKGPLEPDEFPADLISISAHKIYGPRGVGALLAREGVALESFVCGGPQQQGLRGGTENVAAAVGFATAVELAVFELPEEAPRLDGLVQYLRERIESNIDGARFHTPEDGAAPHILSLSFDRVRGESLLEFLDHLGVAVSTGSACNTGARVESRVLAAMGRSRDEIQGAVRFSLGSSTTAELLDEALERLHEAVSQLRAVAPSGAGPRQGFPIQ